MAKKALQKKEKINEEDLLGEVSFEVDKEAFEGPFTCCNRKTKQLKKKMSYKGMEFDYKIWHCSKCGKDYLDSEQSKRMEKIWTIQKILDDKLITMERKMNFDGKTFFFRFPKEISKTWNKNSCADIKMINAETFLVEIKCC